MTISLVWNPWQLFTRCGEWDLDIASMTCMLNLTCMINHANTIAVHHEASAWPSEFVASWLLTLWEPAYDVFIPRFQPKTSSFRLPYQRCSSSADCARELFKSSNRSASLPVCTRKKFFWLGVADFLWVTS